MMTHHFSPVLLNWFDQFGRKNLPWQKDTSAYRVWISEIMLQQTQVATVIPYFQKFVDTFPLIKNLANATMDEILHLWTGLGYYARARNIHKTAKIITYDYDQCFPDELTTLMSLPGIGRSTAGAILSIAFKKSFPILDGNVKRVLTRYHAISGYPGDKVIEKKLWALAADSTPTERCADYTQAIMDLGATVCTRTQPKCKICPLQTNCQAYIQNKTSSFPEPKPKSQLPVRQTQFLILRNDKGKILLEKRPPIGIWGGLWSFPEYKGNQIISYCEHAFHCKVIDYTPGEKFRHTFSHFHYDIQPMYINICQQPDGVMDSNLLWCSLEEAPNIGLSTPVKNLLIREIYCSKKE